jgi:hypothetical protein
MSRAASGHASQGMLLFAGAQRGASEAPKRLTSKYGFAVGSSSIHRASSTGASSRANPSVRYRVDCAQEEEEDGKRRRSSLRRSAAVAPKPSLFFRCGLHLLPPPPSPLSPPPPHILATPSRCMCTGCLCMCLYARGK